MCRLLLNGLKSSLHMAVALIVYRVWCSMAAAGYRKVSKNGCTVTRSPAASGPLSKGRIR